jgi:3-deoxy-D-manno-octulosonic-acid transferase
VAKLFYDLFIRLYPFSIKLISPFNLKAQKWTAGRRGIFEKLQKAIQPTERVIWIHCASLGEFEQGRPVLEQLKGGNPNFKILLTFFSPSGYEVRKDYKGADYIFYLPIDSPRNAKKFFDLVNPALILFIKYEFWHYYLAEAKKRAIPLLLVSGIFRSYQPFFKWYGAFHKKMLRSFTALFVQNEESAKLLESSGLINNVVISGDTRFDRVIEIAESFDPIPIIENFCSNSQVIVAGSTWSEDDEELDHFANTNPGVKFIIAPHDITSDRILECKQLYKRSILYSEILKGADPGTDNVIIIDNIGMLSRLYKYATVCYVGGAFGEDGVHNVLEAAVYGKPVIFGPEYEKYFEAIELIEQGGAISVDNALELEKELQVLLTDQKEYNAAAQASKEYVYSQRGATTKVLDYIYKNRLLTS